MWTNRIADDYRGANERCLRRKNAALECHISAPTVEIPFTTRYVEDLNDKRGLSPVPCVCCNELTARGSDRAEADRSSTLSAQTLWRPSLEAKQQRTGPPRDAKASSCSAISSSTSPTRDLGRWQPLFIRAAGRETHRPMFFKLSCGCLIAQDLASSRAGSEADRPIGAHIPSPSRMVRKQPSQSLLRARGPALLIVTSSAG